MSYYREANKRNAPPYRGELTLPAMLILPDDINALQGKLRRAKRRQRNSHDKRKGGYGGYGY